MLDQKMMQEFLLLSHPVGSLYWSSDSTDPSELFGGTWTRVKDQFVFAAGDSHAVGTVGGEERVTLKYTELPEHYHAVIDYENTNYVYVNTPANGSTYMTILQTASSSSYSNVGSRRLLAGEGYQSRGNSHNNMPPFVTKYCWERTA